MMLIFGLSCLVCYAMANNDPRSITPEELNRLRQEGRYEEFSRHMGLPRPDLARPSTGPERELMYTEGLFQGDMLLTAEQQASVEQSRQVRNLTKFPNSRWPGKPAIMYYVLAENEFTESEINRIHRIIRLWNSRNRCIKIEEKTPEAEDYLYIYAGNGCWAHLGHVGGKQSLSLGHNCVITAVIIHELAHCAGYGHEQSRRDRDDYIKVLWDNLNEAGKGQYEMFDDDYDMVGPYDYYSFTHYRLLAFTFGPLHAFEILNKTIDGSKIGHSMDFSQHDIEKLETLYC